MSRLVRINTEDENGIFNEQLEEDLIINENSTIALQSANFIRNSTTMGVDATTARFIFKSDNSIVGANVDNGNVVHISDATGGVGDYVVDNTNFKAFLSNINHAVNRTLCPFGIQDEQVGTVEANKGIADSGTEAHVILNNKNKVTINVAKRDAFNWTSDAAVQGAATNLITSGLDIADIGGVNALEENATITGMGGSRGIFYPAESFVYDKIHACKGGSYCSVKVHHFSNAVAPTLAGTQGANGIPQFNVQPDVRKHALGSGVPNANYENWQDGQSGFIVGMVDQDGLTMLQHAPHTFQLQHFYAFVALSNNTATPYIFGYGDASNPIIGNQYADFKSVGGLEDHINSLGFEAYYGENYVANDRVGIGISHGKVKFFVGRADGSNVEFMNNTLQDGPRNQLLEQDRDYYWVVCLGGDRNTTILTEVEATQNPFSATPPNFTQSHLGSHLSNPRTLGIVPFPAGDKTVVNPVVEFQYPAQTGVFVSNIDLQEFLGYSFTVPTFTIDADGIARALANVSSHSVAKNEEFIILLNNVPLESYDTVPGGRKNILYTLVQQRTLESQSEVAFNSNYPIHMKIRNKNKLMLRTIQARIVNGKYEKIFLQGQSSLTLLIKDKETNNNM